MNRCSICDGKCIPVMGDGPKPAKVMLIGERPGREENYKHKPFVGQSGQELNETYLSRAGLDREDVYVTNAVKCYAEGNRKPTPKEVEVCARYHLQDELIEVDPELVVLLGSTACSLGQDIDLDMHHGIPCTTSIYDWSLPVFPMYHPAAGLHDTSKMIPLLEDFERLGQYLGGKAVRARDQLIPSYDLITKPIQLLDYLPSEDCEVAIDTERHGSTPFSWQISNRVGTGRMVQCAKDGAKGCAELFSLWLKDTNSTVILHNAPQDLDWLERMGVRVSGNPLRDTMQEAYHLGNQPQGLKALAFRLLGAGMRTYEDVVVPHSRNAMAVWLATAMCYAEDNLSYTETKQLKTKVKTIIKPSMLARGFYRIFQHTTNAASKYDPWKAVQELFDNAKLTPPERQFVEYTRSDSVHSQVMRKLTDMPGPIPITGIEHVPEGEVVRYGCADADMTLRVAHKLEKIRTEIMQGAWDVDKGDWDR